MEEIVVSTLLTNISQLLAKDANLLGGVEDKVRSLQQNQLPKMKNFLKELGSVHNQHSDVIQPLVDDIRKVAGEVEDIIDMYVVNVAKQKRKSSVSKFFGISDQVKSLHEVLSKISLLEKTIPEIYENIRLYKIQRETEYDDEESWMQTRTQYLVQRRRNNVEEAVVGFVKETKTLVDQLITGTDELDVISILGMGGLGKTTLARKVYIDTSVADRFRCRAWISVSQKFKLKELLIEVLKQVALMREEMMGEMSEAQLKEALKKELSHDRYLVVLDDLWKRDDWEELKDAFPNNKNGSRVFITTRIEHVALQSTKNLPFRLGFLNEEESWELFTKKVFRGECCPADLEAPGKEIVKQCKGLPLAIVVVAGLLQSREKTHYQWDTMRKGLLLNIEKETVCHDILGLSYSDLPSYLKPCFLYMGLIPEDQRIPATKLIQLWISEGFIEREDDREQRKEDVARNYLQQLIARSLIQLDETGSDGGIKTCYVHNLIRDLCIRLSMDEKFLETHDNIPLLQTQPRRLSVYHISLRDYIVQATSSNTCNVRTLLCYSKNLFSEDHWENLFKKFPLLRILDMGDTEIQRVPKDIERLILLKYLRVNTAPVAGLPASIFRLCNLLTLDLRWTRINVLPEEIWTMQELRHLYLKGPTRLPQNPGERRLLKLQTLYYVSRDLRGRVQIAQSAPNLRKLGLHGYQCTSGEDKSTFDLEYLESLKFVNPCKFNERIKLPKSVTSISIKEDAFLDTETIRIFQYLSGLQIIKFDGVTFHNNELVFEENCFRELKFLKIESSSIKTWKLVPGAAPKLKRVVISKCPALIQFPMKELLAVTTLQELQLHWLSEKFIKEIAAIKISDQLKLDIYPPVQF